MRTQASTQPVYGSRSRNDRMQFWCGKDRRYRGLHQRGQRRHVNINAQATSRGNGNREDCARLQVARRIPATALPLCYRTAHNGIHLTLPSGKTGSRDARHTRGQRTKRHPCQRRALGNAEVHSLRSLHEHLPRIPPLGWLLIHLLHPRTYRHQPWYAARCVTLQRQRQRLHALPLMRQRMPS